MMLEKLYDCYSIPERFLSQPLVFCLIKGTCFWVASLCMLLSEGSFPKETFAQKYLDTRRLLIQTSNFHVVS